MVVKDSEYLRFVDKALEFCGEVPRYFSRFSNRVFCNHQKLVLLVLKQKLGVTYRGLVELLKITCIPMYIGLKRVPHHTTLVKFAKRVKPKLLNLLLPFRKAKVIGLDATGFEVENKSMHYQMRTARSNYRRHIKLSVNADLDKQIILRQEIHKSPRHDTKDFIPLLKGIKASFVCADKGYDSYKNHKFVIKKLEAKSLIKIKNYTTKNRIARHGRKYREKARKEFNNKIYHQRSKVETIFSVIKRKYGSCLKARTFNTQKKEVLYKLITYNIDRIINFYLLTLRVSAEPLEE
jgi:hypothetical protein